MRRTSNLSLSPLIASTSIRAPVPFMARSLSGCRRPHVAKSLLGLEASDLQMPNPPNEAVGLIEPSPGARSMIAWLQPVADRLHRWPMRRASWP
ncbi:hypothetical protein [Bradyrhizobium forestalis]|uniref:hypothetical protein n=1 Tax=Bradyrhizobium forestalis TaxID=1419263 RepID=UPI0011AF648C|nr:hypothetical protein [Bradyrhizobium forestalis]